jgi:hypothetical protein
MHEKLFMQLVKLLEKLVMGSSRMRRRRMMARVLLLLLHVDGGGGSAVLLVIVLMKMFSVLQTVVRVAVPLPDNRLCQ